MVLRRRTFVLMVTLIFSKYPLQTSAATGGNGDNENLYLMKFQLADMQAEINQDLLNEYAQKDMYLKALARAEKDTTSLVEIAPLDRSSETATVRGNQVYLRKMYTEEDPTKFKLQFINNDRLVQDAYEGLPYMWWAVSGDVLNMISSLENNMESGWSQNSGDRDGEEPIFYETDDGQLVIDNLPGSGWDTFACAKEVTSDNGGKRQAWIIEGIQDFVWEAGLDDGITGDNPTCLRMDLSLESASPRFYETEEEVVESSDQAFLQPFGVDIKSQTQPDSVTTPTRNKATSNPQGASNSGGSGSGSGSNEATDEVVGEAPLLIKETNIGKAEEDSDSSSESDDSQADYIENPASLAENSQGGDQLSGSDFNRALEQSPSFKLPTGGMSRASSAGELQELRKSRSPAAAFRSFSSEASGQRFQKMKMRKFKA